MGYYRIFAVILTGLILPSAALKAQDIQPCSAAWYGTQVTSSACSWAEMNRRLHVFRPATGHAAAMPVLYLPGGPGSKVTAQAAILQRLADTLGRVLIVPDHFGSGESSDRPFTCTATDRTTGPFGVATDAESARLSSRADQEMALLACVSQIQLTPPDVTAMGTERLAQGLVGLQATLGLPSWSVMAESYGARPALRHATLNADKVEALVLDSPETPWDQGFYRIGSNFLGALDALADLCRKDRYCPSRRKKLADSLLDKIAAYAPAELSPAVLENKLTRETEAYVLLTQEQLLIRAYAALRSPVSAGYLPYIAQSYSDQELQQRFTLLLPNLNQPQDSLSFTVYNGVRCSEYPQAHWQAVLEADAARTPGLKPLLDYIAWRQGLICRVFGIAAPSALPAFDAPATIPVLLLSGTIDPVTPPDVVAAAFAALPRAGQIVYPATGHGVTAQRPCAASDVKAFLETGGDLPKATQCSKAELKLGFYAPLTIR